MAKKHLVTQAHGIPASQLDPPADAFRDRSDNVQHMNELVDRFTETRTMTSKLLVGFVFETKSELKQFEAISDWNDWLDDNAEVRDDPSSDMLKDAIAERHHPAYTVGGDHSRMAGTICQGLYPLIPKMWKCDPKIYAGLRSDDEYMRFLRLVGGVHNLQNYYKKKDYADKLRGARRCYLDTVADGTKPVSDQRGSKAIKEDFMFQYDIKTGNAGLYMMVASMSQSIYDLIEQIVSGRDINMDTKIGKTFKVPSGNRFFLSIPGLDEDQVCDWLQEIINGRRDLKSFLSICNRARARLRIMSSILALLKLFQPDEVTKDMEWKDVVDEWGQTCSDPFISRWILTYAALKIKEGDPSAFVAAVQKNISEDLQEKTQVNDSKLVIPFFVSQS
jgi:hypothetical protein